jgi:hypothetical protein
MDLTLPDVIAPDSIGKTSGRRGAVFSAVRAFGTGITE